MKAWNVALVVALIVLAIPVRALPDMGTGSDAAKYGGSYRYIGSQEERKRVEAAIDAATKGMIGADIAKKELIKRSEIRPSYTLNFDGQKATVSSKGFPPESTPLDGSAVKMTNKYGDKLEMQQRFTDGALLQESKTHDGEGSTKFKLQTDGKTLVVTRISKSPKLPRPVEFSLTYRRQ
jgi:hypothetical protein